MEPINVTVAGSLSVPVKADALSLVMEIDPAMHRDIADEAIRTAVSEKLGGFQGVLIERAPSAKPSSMRVTPGEAVTATVQFDALAHSIHQLISAYDHLAGAADALERPLAVLEGGADGRSDQEQAALQELRECVNGLRSLGPAGPPEAPSGGTAPEATAAATAEPACAVDSEREASDTDSFDAHAAGYAPLLDDDGDDDENVEGNEAGETEGVDGTGC